MKKGIKIFLIALCAVFILGAVATAFDVISFDGIKEWFDKEEPGEDPVPGEDNGDGSANDGFEDAVLVCEADALPYLVVKDGNGSEVKPFNANGMYFINTTSIYTLSTLEGKTLKITFNGKETEFSASAPYQFRASAIDDKISVSLVGADELPDDGGNSGNEDLTPGGDVDNTFCTVIYMDDSAFDICSFTAPDGYTGESITPSYINTINAGMPIKLYVPSETLYISESGFGDTESAVVVSGVDWWTVDAAEDGKSYYIWNAAVTDTDELGIPSDAELQEISFEIVSVAVNMNVSTEAYYNGTIKIYEGTDSTGTAIALDEGVIELVKGRTYTFKAESGTYYIDFCCPTGSIPCTDAITIAEGSSVTYTPDGDFALHIDAASQASTMSLRGGAESSAVQVRDTYDDTNGVSYPESDIIGTDKGWTDFY